MKVGQCRPVCGHRFISWRQKADVSDILSRVTVLRCVSVLSDLKCNSQFYAACVQPVNSLKLWQSRYRVNKFHFLRSLVLQLCTHIYTEKLNRLILVNNQLDAQFFMYVYFCPLHVYNNNIY